MGTITYLWSYTDYARVGDVIDIVASPLVTCQNGLWPRMADPGAKQGFAMIQTYGRPTQSLNTYGYDNPLGSG